MATLSFLEETKEQKHDIDNTSKASTVTDVHPFSWINRWIIYCPMLTSSTIKNSKIIKRNEMVSKICGITIIVIVLFLCCWDIVLEIIEYDFNLFTLVWSLSISLMNMSRLLAVYYFFYHFKFYGASYNDTGSSLQLIQHHKLTKVFSIRMKIVLFLAILCLLIINISSLILLFTGTAEDDEEQNSVSSISSISIFEFFNNFFSIYLYDIPLFLSQFILSIFYCRGCIFISSLNEIIEKSLNIDFEIIIKEYSIFREEFKKQINLLEKILMLRLCSLMAFVWIDISLIIEAKSWTDGINSSLWFIIAILPFTEMVFAGNYATSNFYSFKKKLYLIGTGVKYKSFFEDESIDHSQYLYLLDYVQEYPFLIKIFAKEVSFKNAIRVIAALSVAKIIQYLFKAHMI